MAAILPVPISRISDLLSSQRIVRQIQSDHRELFRIQTQLSTGRRIISPSDDAPAALRAMTLQRLLERKAHAQSSLKESVLFLSAAETAIGEVSTTLNSIKSAALGVDDTISTSEQRRAVVDEIDRAIQQLVEVGNSRFRERYLFSGSKSQQAPYQYEADFVEFLGNEEHLRTYVDVDFLFENNVPGGEVFGGLSHQVRGTVDISPQLRGDTQLGHLNGGAGVSGGAVEIVYVDASDEATSSVVDISGAATIEDVARYLQNGVPEGSGIRVEVTGTGLTLSTSDASESVFVREVGEGRTARDLGIYSTVPQSSLVGDDITPAVIKTTKLADLLGTRAQATVISGGSNNDFTITASQNGDRVDPLNPTSDPLNGVTLQFVDGALAGNESAVYDPVAATLTVTIQSGATTAAQVIDAVKAEPSGLFSAAIDFRDATSVTQAGQGTVALTSTATTSGGSGEVLDQTSGLKVTNGGKTVDVDISSAETVEDLLNILNQEVLGLHVEINAQQNGINIRSRWSGADLTIGEVAGGRTATQLGVRTLTEDTRIDRFNRGVGVVVGDEATLAIELTTGGVATSYEVDLSSTITVGDVFDTIAAQTGGNVTAQLTADGNGIELIDNTSADSIAVSGQAAGLLGCFGEGETSASSATGTLTADDRHTLEVDSAFNTLFRLREALLNEDFPAIGAEINRLDEDLSRVNFARSDIGARLKSLETLQTRHEDEEVSLRSALSDQIDVDLTRAISEFTNRQYALQASLNMAGNMLQLTLLDFI